MLFRYFLIILSLSYGPAIKAGDLSIPKDIILSSLTAEDKVQKHITCIEKFFEINGEPYRLHASLEPREICEGPIPGKVSMPNDFHPTLEQAISALQSNVTFEKDPERETKWKLTNSPVRSIHKTKDESAYTTDPFEVVPGKQYSYLAFSLKMLSAVPTGKELILI